MYDIAIIGGGPAGITLARLVGGTYRILLIEKRTWASTARSEKCCGGLLAPDAQRMLAHLGLGLPQSVLVGPQLFVVRTIDIDNGLERYYQRHYINIDRAKFDGWLHSLLPRATEVRYGCVFRSLERTDDGYKVTYCEKNKCYTEKARLIVGADGAASSLRRQVSAGTTMPRMYIGLQEWYQADDPLPYFSAIFDRSITDFYAWLIPKDTMIILGAALSPDRGAVGKFETLRKKIRKYDIALGRRLKRQSGLLVRPVNTHHIHVGTEGTVLIGEAAGWISPSSAEGLSYALRSAVYLADALGPGMVHAARRYRRNCRSLFMNIRLKNMKSPFMYRPALRRIVMRLGVKSVFLRVPGNLDEGQYSRVDSR